MYQARVNAHHKWHLLVYCKGGLKFIDLHDKLI